MARSDLLISLAKAGTAGDQVLFRKTLEAIVAEERARNTKSWPTSSTSSWHQTAITSKPSSERPSPPPSMICS